MIEILTLLWNVGGSVNPRTKEEQIRVLKDIVEIKNNEIKRLNPKMQSGGN